MTSGQTTQPAGPAAARSASVRPAGSLRSGDAASDLTGFLVGLLEFQCALVGALAGAVYLAGSQARRAGIAATFTSGASASGPLGAGRPEELLSDVMLRRIERLGAQAAGPAGGTGVQEEITLSPAGLYEARATHRVIAAPLSAEGRTEGASVLVLPASAPLSTGEALARLALTGSRFETFLWRQQCLTEASQKTRLREALELLDAAQQGSDARSMAAILCHELQRRFGCTRVSLGLIPSHGDDRLRLMAVSGADDLDRRGAAVEAIEAAMEECASQDIEVVYPPPPESEADPAQRRVTRAHQELSRRFGPAAMLSLPLRVEGDLAGVALLERESTDPFPQGAASLLRLIAEFIGPAVWSRRLADRGVLAVSRDRTLELGQAIVGPRHTGAKLLGLLVLLVAVALAAVPIPDRVSARAEVKAQIYRTIVPPFTGYLKEVNVRAGDRVEPGQVLAVMDDTELSLQLARYNADRDALSTQRDDAQSKGDPAKARALEAQITQAQASIAVTQDKLDHSQIRSPIGGLVSKGDLDPFIGARIDPTQPLLEVVGPDRLVAVQIPERDIARVLARLEADKEVTGHLVTKALPDRKIPVRITQVNPAAEVVEGANVYLAEATILPEQDGRDPRPTDWLKPGMTGTVKIDDGYTTGLVVIFRPIVDELRLRLWF